MGDQRSNPIPGAAPPPPAAFAGHASRNVKSKFLSHLFGLDTQPNQPTLSKWTPSLSGLKLSDALNGINMTGNMWFGILFLGFFAWLFVLYWVRHNEPLADQVLGTPKAHASTAGDDRRLVAGIKKVLPVRTTSKTGDFYCPGNEVPPIGHHQTFAAHPVQSQVAQAAPAPSAYGLPAGYVVSGQSGMSHPAQVFHAQPLQAQQAPYSFGNSRGGASANGSMAGRSAFHVGVKTAEGTKLKTIVNR